MPKVSVIVPVYNTGKYLRQCLDSIVAQTLRDLEIIVVNDGSTDDSPAIIREYAARDDRIVVINKPNGGLGAAYNRGIDAATAPYIGFVESDDWIEPDMFHALYDAITQHDADLAKSSFWIYNSAARKKDRLWTLPGKIDITKEYPRGAFKIDDFPQLGFMHSSLWSYLYRADFVKKILFGEYKGAGYPDFDFVFEVLCRAEKIAVVPRPLLHWRLEEGQNNSSQIRDNRALAMTDRCIRAKEILRRRGKYGVLKEAFYFHCFAANRNLYQRTRREFKKEYFDRLRVVFDDIKNDADFRYEYFGRAQREWVEDILCGRFCRRLPNAGFRGLKRWLFSLHAGRRGFLFQLLGLQFSTGQYADEMRPALAAIRI